jgi:hypothetical protein
MHTGRLFVDVATPGATLTGDTRTNYSAVVVSPEPASLVLVATGAGLALAGVRRRRVSI